MAPILCTQPRRFAVVTVARMVAKSRNSEVGDEVGYHIGHSKLLSERLNQSTSCILIFVLLWMSYHCFPSVKPLLLLLLDYVIFYVTWKINQLSDR